MTHARSNPTWLRLRLWGARVVWTMACAMLTVSAMHHVGLTAPRLDHYAAWMYMATTVLIILTVLSHGALSKTWHTDGATELNHGAGGPTDASASRGPG